MSDELLKTARVEANELAREDDLNFAFKSIFGDMRFLTKALCGINSNFIIGGSIRKGTDWNIVIDPIIGININSDSEYPGIGINGTTHTIAISEAKSAARVDTVYIKPSIGSTKNETRTFSNDFQTVTSQSVDTQTILNIDYEVIEGDSTLAKSVPDDNCIKIAEIYVPADIDSITDSDCIVYPVTKDLSSETNSNWTADKNSTTKIYSLMEFQNIFRTCHNQDGSLKNSIVSSNNLLKGTNTGEINLESFVLGASMYGLGANTSLSTLIATMKSDIDKQYSTWENTVILYADSDYNIFIDVNILSASHFTRIISFSQYHRVILLNNNTSGNDMDLRFDVYKDDNSESGNGAVTYSIAPLFNTKQSYYVFENEETLLGYFSCRLIIQKVYQIPNSEYNNLEKNLEDVTSRFK